MLEYYISVVIYLNNYYILIIIVYIHVHLHKSFFADQIQYRIFFVATIVLSIATVILIFVVMVLATIIAVTNCRRNPHQQPAGDNDRQHLNNEPA